MAQRGEISKMKMAIMAKAKVMAGNGEISRSENGESMIFNGRNEMKAGNQLNG
jgi:hypothetical protein